MSRGYWRIILAAVGLLAALGIGQTAYQLYNAAEQQHADYRYQPAREARRVILVPSNTEPKGYQPDCQNPQGNSNADLCAQWAAVDQVTEANRLNALNVRLALFISLLTLTGTGLLVWTFLETRDTSRRELRAYVFVDSTAISAMSDKKVLPNLRGKPAALVMIKNSGETPAYELIHWGQMALRPASEESGLTAPRMERIHMTTLPPGGINQKALGTNHKPTRSEIAAIKRGELVFFVWGRIEYVDAFGIRRYSNYRNRFAGWPLPANANPAFCVDGNDSN